MFRLYFQYLFNKVYRCLFHKFLLFLLLFLFQTLFHLIYKYFLLLSWKCFFLLFLLFLLFLRICIPWKVNIRYIFNIESPAPLSTLMQWLHIPNINVLFIIAYIFVFKMHNSLALPAHVIFGLEFALTATNFSCFIITFNIILKVSSLWNDLLRLAFVNSSAINHSNFIEFHRFKSFCFVVWSKFKKS